MNSESSSDRLTLLQRELLEAFFAREQGFYLTGGAALAGFYLRHRETTDLDLFADRSDDFDRGTPILRDAAASLGAEVVVRQDAPGFRRFVVSRGSDAVLVDLVWERVPPVHAQKLTIRGIRIDPIEEILVNKLTAVVSRVEERDLVDLLKLEQAGYRVESALAGALQKDGGCTPAALAWVLSQVAVPDGASLPAGVSPAELRAYLVDLKTRLLKASAPHSFGT